MDENIGQHSLAGLPYEGFSSFCTLVLHRHHPSVFDGGSAGSLHLVKPVHVFHQGNDTTAAVHTAKDSGSRNNPNDKPVEHLLCTTSRLN